MSLVAGWMLVASAATSLAQTATVDSVQAVTTPDGGIKFTIEGTNLSKPKELRARNNTLYIAEFDANLGSKKHKVDVNKAGVEYFQVGWFTNNPPRVRFVLKIDEKINPVLGQEDGKWVITIPGTKKDKADPKPKPKSNTSNGVEVPVLPYPTEAIPLPKVENANQSVGSSTIGTYTAALAEAQQAPPLPKPSPDPGAARVSLDFVGTDVIQILKALSIQSSVNIIAAPDVSPTDKPTKITVALNNVSLDEALSFITALSDLRYARIDNTYIVTPSATFSESMRQVMERTGNKFETRVISLVSGEAEKIKEATLRAMPRDGRYGYYELIVPNSDVLPGVGAPPTTTEGEKAPAAAPAKAKRSFYLMIVGDPKRMDEVELHVRDLDLKITRTSSFNRSEDLATVVVPIQSGETGRIKQMIDRLVAEHPRGAEFSISESMLEGTTKGEASTMALLMFGPKDELVRLESWAKALDEDLCAIMGKTYATNEEALEKVWEVVDLNYVEPTLLEMQLKTKFKGLQVSLMPDPVTPGMTGSTKYTDNSTAATGEGSGNEETGAAADGGTESQSESTEKDITGREPMKIVLRGTRAQIDEAKHFISLVDVAPKQVALELRVMELTKEEALRIGIDWSALTGGRLVSWRFNQGLGDVSSTPGTINKVTDPTGGTGDTLDFLATLDQINNGRNLLARPNALVTDGRSTNLFVGDTVRYIKSIQSTQNGVTVQTDEVNVGVNFNVGARIGGDGSINMMLDQNFSILTGFTPVPGGGSLPQTSDRHSSMFVNMKSGETLAIGGLILDQDRKRISGIPILKDLPIIGYLFSRTDNSRVRTEIVFFLTAVVVDETNRANAASPKNSEKINPNPLEDYKEKKAIKGDKKPLN